MSFVFRNALVYRSVCLCVVGGRAFVARDNVGNEVGGGVVFVLVRMSHKLVPLECVIFLSWEERIVLIGLVREGLKVRGSSENVLLSCLLDCRAVILF